MPVSFLLPVSSPLTPCRFGSETIVKLARRVRPGVVRSSCNRATRLACLILAGLTLLLTGCAIQGPYEASDVSVIEVNTASDGSAYARTGESNRASAHRARGDTDDIEDDEFVEEDASTGGASSQVAFTTELNPAVQRHTAASYATESTVVDVPVTRQPGSSGDAEQPSESVSTDSSPMLDAMLAFSERWHGVRYRWGGATAKGIDCSALVVRLYGELFGQRLPRTTRQQVQLGRRVQLDQLRPGDLIFFRLSRGRRHVGVYVGGGRFLHASRSRGVAFSEVNASYWRRHFWQAKRLTEDLQVAALQP